MPYVFTKNPNCGDPSFAGIFNQKVAVFEDQLSNEYETRSAVAVGEMRIGNEIDGLAESAMGECLMSLSDYVECVCQGDDQSNTFVEASDVDAWLDAQKKCEDEFYYYDESDPDAEPAMYAKCAGDDALISAAVARAEAAYNSGSSTRQLDAEAQEAAENAFEDDLAEEDFAEAFAASDAELAAADLAIAYS